MKKKVRINELARELEVKAHEILERLPELGVSEKKTHSSSIDEDVAIRLKRLYGFEGEGPGSVAQTHEEPDVAVHEGERGESPAPVAVAPPSEVVERGPVGDA